MPEKYADNWKALVLAAGFGTRLRPFTEHTPKPLFTINRQPVLDIIINQLIAAGCGGVTVNTHHRHTAIERFLAAQTYPIPVRTCYEPEILGTGGAIKNNADFFDTRPFLVINSDIYTDIDLSTVYDFHTTHSGPVTLVLVDDTHFNSVAVNTSDHIIDFAAPDSPGQTGDRCLTFSGIHVLDPDHIMPFLPKAGTYADIIPAYKALLAGGKTIHACIPENIIWHDIGTPDRYRAVVFDIMAQQALQQAGSKDGPFTVEPLQPDGSDTNWFRVRSGNKSLVARDRGLRTSETANDADAFTNIGHHLTGHQLAVPRLYLSDSFSGLTFMEDLGDTTLQHTVKALNTTDATINCYQPVLDRLADMAVKGARGFDTAWTYQTTRYDKQVILEKECRYFVEAFLNGYLGTETAYDQLFEEFDALAEMTLAAGIEGFLHRDMQSRNIMMPDKGPHFIDFQGGRLGPVQYDLASLLIDPYVGLPSDIQDTLVTYYLRKLTELKPVDTKQFHRGYGCCRVTRNLQILGAFGFLTRKKNKNQFAKYIPSALATLRQYLIELAAKTKTPFPRLMAAVEGASKIASAKH